MLELFRRVREETLGRILQHGLWIGRERICGVEGVLAADFEEEVTFADLTL
jgi:hypothetical protein